jgi:hypothetical protein
MMLMKHRRRKNDGAEAATLGAVETTTGEDIDRLSVSAASQRRALDVLSPAFAAVRERPMRIDVEMRSGTVVTTARARVDMESCMLEGAMLLSRKGHESTVYRYVLVNGKIQTLDAAPTAEEALFGGSGVKEMPDGSDYMTLLEQVFTGYGRVESTLSRILLLLSNVPFASRVTDRPGAVREVLAVLSPWAIHSYYKETGLEAVGSTVPTGLTRLAFRIEHGLLRGLIADGPHFRDGIARELSATAVHTPIRPFVPRVLPAQ